MSDSPPKKPRARKASGGGSKKRRSRASSGSKDARAGKAADDPELLEESSDQTLEIQEDGQNSDGDSEVVVPEVVSGEELLPAVAKESSSDLPVPAEDGGSREPVVVDDGATLVGREGRPGAAVAVGGVLIWNALQPEPVPAGDVVVTLP